MVDRQKVEEAVRLLLGKIRRARGWSRRRRASPVCTPSSPRVWTRTAASIFLRRLALAAMIWLSSAISRSIPCASITCCRFTVKRRLAIFPTAAWPVFSKLARTGRPSARRLQLQEQLCAQVADAMMEFLAPQGVIVSMEAEHMCMTMRGVQKPGTKTVTLARRGVLEDDQALEQRFFNMLDRG